MKYLCCVTLICLSGQTYNLLSLLKLFEVLPGASTRKKEIKDDSVCGMRGPKVYIH